MPKPGGRPAIHQRRDPQQPEREDPEQGPGHDGAKKVNGHKWHLLVDTLGLLLTLHVTRTDISDRDGAAELLRRLDRRHLPRLRYGWADRGYRGGFLAWALTRYKIAFEVVAR